MEGGTTNGQYRAVVGTLVNARTVRDTDTSVDNLLGALSVATAQNGLDLAAAALSSSGDVTWANAVERVKVDGTSVATQAGSDSAVAVTPSGDAGTARAALAGL